MGWNTEHLSFCVKLDLVKLDLLVVLNELGLVFCWESLFKVTIDQNYYTRDKCIFICIYFSTSILGFIFKSNLNSIYKTLHISSYTVQWWNLITQEFAETKTTVL